MMKYDKAINRPDGKAWTQEIEREHEQIMKHKVWRTVEKSQVPKGTKILGSVWSMKKKADGSL